MVITSKISQNRNELEKIENSKNSNRFLYEYILRICRGNLQPITILFIL